MNTTKQRAIGATGERVASQWLTAHGYTVCAHNVRNRYGEIDIVAKKGKVIHFVEVKTREGGLLGAAVEAGMGKKLERSIRAASAIAGESYPTWAYCLDILSIENGQVRFFENVTL